MAKKKKYAIAKTNTFVSTGCIIIFFSKFSTMSLRCSIIPESASSWSEQITTIKRLRVVIFPLISSPEVLITCAFLWYFLPSLQED